MGTVSVAAPWRSDGGHRDATWQYLRPRWDSVGQVVEGSCPSGPWVKATAVADAVSRASGDVLVVADTDVWTDGISEAVDMVASGRALWAVPHTLVHRLSEESSAAVIAGRSLGGHVEERPYRGFAGGGVVVITSALWDECPLDRRFLGWGQEDQAWGIALTAIAGQPWRGTSDLWHLWHPPQPRLSRSTGSMAGRRLLAEYQAAAAAGRDGMSAYLAGLQLQTRRRTTMWIYRNTSTGDTHELAERSPRLDRLGNWELVGHPSDVGVTLPGPEAEAPEPAVTGPDSDLYVPPARAASKAEWLAYARWRQVPDCDRMTKSELIAACRQ
jgi:hypothetical protein